MAIIDFLNAVKYTDFKNSKHQEAWALLNKECPPDLREKFQTLFRAKPEIVVETQNSGEIYIYAKWSGKYDQYSNKIFGMYLMNGDKVVDKLPFTSGQSYAQDVVWPLDDWSGSMRPLPEGIYDIGALDDIGYDPGASDGFGQWVYPLNPRAAIKRSALLVHADRNRQTSPGSAGCCCPYTPEEMLKFVTWMSSKAKPKYFVMDHALGFLKQKQNFTAPSIEKK
jgi:hypothetical protein